MNKSPPDRAEIRKECWEWGISLAVTVTLTLVVVLNPRTSSKSVPPPPPPPPPRNHYQVEVTGGRSFQVASYSGPYTPGYITYMKLDGLTGLVAGSFTIEDLPEPVEPVEAKEPK